MIPINPTTPPTPTPAVSVRRCGSYEYGEVREALGQALADLGGLAGFVSPGEKVLLKVNMLLRKKPEDGATTHPAVVRAMADILAAHGAEPVIGDSPGGLFTPALLKAQYQGCGFDEAARLSGARLNFNCGASVRPNPGGLLLKSVRAVDMLNDVDKVISMPKFKVHGMMTYTGAVKNMFGVVPGLAKAEYHLNMPDYDDFANALIDVCLCAAPVLSVMDGIEAMEGNGPSGGDIYRMNCVMASGSPFHLDRAACAMIGLGAGDVPLLRNAVLRGILAEDGSDAVYAGDPPEAFYAPGFKKPVSGRSLMNMEKYPKPLARFMDRHAKTRPAVRKELCVGCGECARNCPAKVIGIEGGKAVISCGKCIRCYCCQELCPKKAVEIHKPVIARLFS